ncbi:hypothetical protein C8F01DRAFT_566852 [Mycena amicta]|nr:hypothetical protein C8F01DRAFT_566852 [Mycena amicta]
MFLPPFGSRFKMPNIVARKELDHNCHEVSGRASTCHLSWSLQLEASSTIGSAAPTMSVPNPDSESDEYEDARTSSRTSTPSQGLPFDPRPFARNLRDFEARATARDDNWPSGDADHDSSTHSRLDKLETAFMKLSAETLSVTHKLDQLLKLHSSHAPNEAWSSSSRSQAPHPDSSFYAGLPKRQPADKLSLRRRIRSYMDQLISNGNQDKVTQQQRDKYDQD